MDGGFLNLEGIVNALNVQEGMQIADFGCGSGHFAIALAKKTGKEGKLTALDIQEDALENVKVKASVAGLENIDAVRANLEVLGSTKLPDNSQNLVFAANVLFQSPKKQEIIKEAARILKSGGILFAVEWKKGKDGFGPPENLKLDEEELKAIISAEGLNFERSIDAGQYHFGLVFRK